MKKVFKPLITVLFLSIIISLLMPAVSALAATGRINGEGVRVRNKATTQNSTILTSLALGTVVTINSVTNGQEAVSGGGTKWYNITYGGVTGYVYGKYLDEITTNNSDSNFETTLLSFPAGYRDALRSIHREYPNWIFTPDNLSISLDSAINLEYSQSSLSSTRKWIELSYGAEWRDERVDINNSSHIKESRWTYASRAAIAYFMDVRNGLTVTNSKS